MRIWAGTDGGADVIVWSFAELLWHVVTLVFPAAAKAVLTKLLAATIPTIDVTTIATIAMDTRFFINSISHTIISIGFTVGARGSNAS